MENARPISSAQPPAPKAKRAPSAEIAGYFARGAATLVYVDVGGLGATEVIRGVLANAGAFTDAATAQCVVDASRAVSEIAIGLYAEGLLGAVRYDPAKLDTKACFEGALSLAAPNIALFGSKALVERATAGGGRLPASLALDEGEWARLSIDNEPLRATGSLTITGALFALRAEADMPETTARDITRDFEKSRATLPTQMKDATSDEREMIAKLLRFTTFQHDHGHVTFALELHEPPVDQAHDVGVMAALAIHGVRKYLLESKEAEARNAVPAIARSIAAWWEREEMPGAKSVPRAKKKLQSFPPIPPTVPRGTKYQPSEKEWATWSAIKFEMDQPMYYQYEVRAAKDGESADVIARGDLNGDGKTSSFVITIKVKKDKDRTLEISPIVETDPDE